MEDRRWKQHELFYLENISAIISRVKYGTEKWIHRLWQKICLQYNTNKVEVIAEQMMTVMTGNNSSIIYHLFSFQTNKPYIGLVQDRAGIKRATEHWAAIHRKSTDAYYSQMGRVGAADTWYWLPIIISKGVVPIKQLMKMENTEIKAHQNCWNNSAHRKTNVKKHLETLRKEKPDRPPRTKCFVARPIRMETFAVRDNGQVEIEMDFNKLLGLDSFVVHSSRLHSIPTRIFRKYKRSIVDAVSIDPDQPASDSSWFHSGSLRRAIKHGKKQVNLWLWIRVVTRKTNNFQRSADYRLMETTVLTDKATEKACENLAVDELYALWWISRRVCSEGQHMANHIVIRNELRARGFMALPDQMMVLKIPPDARIRQLDIRIIVKQMFRQSMLPTRLSTAMMWSFTVVYQQPRLFGANFDTTKHWTPGTHPWACQCHRYPASWPRRHGHIFIPSFRYRGRYKRTVQSLATGVITTPYDHKALAKAIKEFWFRYLPSGLCPGVKVPLPDPNKPQARSYLSADTVRELKHYMQYLTVMGIDKCRNRKLILCPALYDRYYRATFPVETDSVHFVAISEPVDLYERWLLGIYVSKKWSQIASWHNGSPPVPYPLFKLKDILDDCATVFKKKGKCCRNRPISPNTDHWLRRVYKRIGSVLRLICLQIPPSAVNLLRTPDLKTKIAKWSDEADEVGSGEWLVFTGDVANCYDELDHDRVLDGVQWGLSMLAVWTNKRVVDRFSVNRFNRKDAQIGACYSDKDRILITRAQVMEVCEFDIHNSVMLVFGKLWRRRRGAPMGGFLSAFYTILCFSHIEYKCISPMFVKVGVPGGIVRYLDDVLVAAFITDKSSRDRLLQFRAAIEGSGVYPAPLDLNLEPIGDSDFLEGQIRGGGSLQATLLNKTALDIIEGREPYRRRFADLPEMCARDAVDLATGIIIRSTQMCTTPELLDQMLWCLKLEVATHRNEGLQNKVFDRALARADHTLLRQGNEKARKVLQKTKSKEAGRLG